MSRLLAEFRPRESRSGKSGSIFTSFQPAISKVALKDKGQRIRQWRIYASTTNNLEGLAEWINPVVRGWMNYYGRFNRWEMYSLLRSINTYLMRWARKKFKRLRAYKRVKAWWKRLVERRPEMFVHWAWMREFTF